MSPVLRSGDSLARYRVVSSIGAGGMGEVYKAIDDSLDRPVALKILPPELVKNEERVRRFIQEAKSASSLSHPHIVAIYEIGQADVRGEDETDASTVQFIAMELVDGRTLREEIHEDRTALRVLLTYLAQAADALAKAHAAGIVHRDLKPDNIMITRDGYAKVLDFGLAKLTEKRTDGQGQTDAPTAVHNKTREGTVLGTVGYMSPEQVQGKPVDHRSDIFSFGCILYEAATRQRPFTADSDVDTMHRIIHDKPQAIDELNPNVPAELRRLIRRCLAKEPDKRFQSMKDLSIELGEIVDEWDELSPSSNSGSGSGAALAIAPRRSVSTIAIVSAALLIVVAALIFAFTRSRGGQTAEPARGFSQMKIKPLTGSGNVVGAIAVSPDGRYVAHSLEEKGQFSLIVRQVATGADVRVVAPSSNPFIGATFTSDGNYLYFVQTQTSLFSSLFQIPSLGGAPTKLIDDIDTPVTFSPDGKRLTFGRGYQPAETALMVAAADGNDVRKLATSKGKDRYQIFLGPAWSPDGRSIAMVKRAATASDVLALIDADSGKEQIVSHRRFDDIRGIAWTPDGRGIIMAASDTQSAPGQIWRVGVTDGEGSRITNDLTDYNSVSVTADGKAIAATQRQITSNIWSKSSEGAPAPLTSGGGMRVMSIQATPDHLIFIAADQSGRNIWTSKLDGTEARVIVRDPEGLCCLSATTDGGTIVFTSSRNGGVPQVFVAKGDGTGARQVTTEQVSLGPTAISPDGKWFVYRRAGGETELMRASTAGGPPTVVGKDYLAAPSIAPDGSAIVGSFVLPVGSASDTEVRSYPVGGGAYTVLPVTQGDPRNMIWVPGQKALSYLRNEDLANVWIQPLDGSPARSVTSFKDGVIRSHAWSPDGKTLFVARGDENTDVALITDFN